MSSESSSPFPLQSLRWHRLSARLVNIRSSPAIKEHPFSVFQAIIKGASSALNAFEEPLIFFHIKGKGHTFRIQESAVVPLEIFFFQKDAGYVSRWAAAFRDYLSDPVTGRNYDIVEIGDAEERSFDILMTETGVLPEEGEICLEYLSPLPFNREKGKHRTFISRETFIKTLENRLSRLSGRNIVYESGGDDFSILPYYWNYAQLSHASKSRPGHTQYINGCAGKLYIKGRFKNLLPFLILGSEAHCGTKLSNSQGYYILHKESPGFFDRQFPNKKALTSVIKDVLDRYDNALESLSTTEKFPLKEDEFAGELCARIVEDKYFTTPHTAFLIKKKSGVDRLVEQLAFRDLIVHQYLLKTVSTVFDRVFEEGSIGFRKGFSRHKAIEVVQSAVSEGFEYVIESDIDDFFPSVNLETLEALLGFYLPAADSRLKYLIQKSIRTGYVLNGILHERVKGLAQGSPLSPLLANLYLDSFDEQIKSWNVKMARYADDFVILARSKEEAEAVLSKTETFLSGLGLKIKKEKTAVRHIKEGFQFLGMQFGRTEIIVESDEDIKRLKKPLYVTAQHTFLSLNGEALDIKRQGEIIETIPLRRISEIIVMEKASFSTALLTSCTDCGIPITVTLNSGYFITTVKPDSKRYYSVSYEHGSRHYSLTDTETLSLAKEFAAGKLRNYVSLFKQRYSKDTKTFIAEIERTINDINQAGGINEARGYEGSAAKKIYPQLNRFIDDGTFHITRRQRRKPDRINSLLNYGYYLLFSRINATVRALGLNPYLGFLHSPEDNYESLVCDIEELFRSRIDRLIIRMVNLKVITKDDFTETEKGLYLTRDALAKFLNQFDAEMERKTPGNGLSLKENIYVQTSVVKNFMLENKPMTFYVWDV
ncbi:MAG: CRISPR-associated endonuclease Cas1 [Nitrospirae bacterium]|nr:CRISPR-associated endonuclease Cas1 [Nitrospirota bacterium]